MVDKNPNCSTCGHRMVNKGAAGSGNIRWGCSKCNTRTTDPAGFNVGIDLKLAKQRYEYLRDRIDNGCTKFLVTSAINNTRKAALGLKAMLRWCKYNNAELIVMPVHYKNVSAYTSNETYEKYWDKDLVPYLICDSLDISRSLVVRADIRIAATAQNPLSGTEPINGDKWTIFGHGKMLMEPVACPSHKVPKRMYTTGAVTLKNYSQTKLGAKADFHHVMGGLVVELTKKRSFIRQINIDSKGHFYDLDKLYTPERVKPNQRVEALITGDDHERFYKKSVRKATFDAPNSIVKVLRPKKIVRHDVFDCYFGTHHHDKDDVKLFMKHHKGLNDGRGELESVIRFINETTPDDAQTLIVRSNHHDHLYKWLSKVDPKKDHQNALLIHELKALQYQNVLKNKTADPFEIYLSSRLKCNFKFLDPDSVYLIKGIDVGQHGDKGLKGSRGSARGFAKLTNKMFIAHAHTARIVLGVFQVGKGADELEYEGGLSDTTNTHGVIYTSGKRSLLDIFDNDWHG